MENNLPLVSVNVLAYNSSKYIVETLESIYTQTYQNIELVISDDKSTDNTVAICQKWVDAHRSRFADVQILVPDHNTGQSGNYNRAFRAAKGEWIKEIDGDDLLLPNCVTDLVVFVKSHHECKYLFGKMSFFGGNKTNYDKYEKVFDYSFFELSQSDQLSRLLEGGNCIPSPTSFYSKPYMLEIGFENDERIPYMEDYPKWIRLLQLGVKYYFLDKEIASYRVGSGISTQLHHSSRYFKTQALFDYYYRLPFWSKECTDKGVERLVEERTNVYTNLLNDYDAIKNSYSFRLGQKLLAPLILIRNILSKS